MEDIGRAWRIGAGVTHARIEDMRGKLAGRRDAVRGGGRHRLPGDPQPRHDRRQPRPCRPGRRLAAALAALGATVNISGRRRRARRCRRRFRAGRLHHGACATTRSSKSIDVPKLSRAGRYGYYKFCRKTGEFAEASAAAVFDPERGAARIFLGAVRPAPVALARAGPARRPGGTIRRLSRSRRAPRSPRRRRSRSSRAAHGGGRRDARLAAGVRVVTPIALTVNGRTVQALVEPRTHLGDFLREHCRLTGTHLGCEHGVCGACTVLIDGDAGPLMHHLRGRLRRPCRSRPSRGSTMTRPWRSLREAFSREHALQCGFCTPGMLIASRDIVRAASGCGRAAHPGRAVRQSVPVHRLSRHRQCGAQRDRGPPATAGRGRCRKPVAAPPRALATFVPKESRQAGAAAARRNGSR